MSTQLPAHPEPSRQVPPAVTVLVVDDDPLQRALCARFLRDDGQLVHEAANGLEALEAVRRVHPDVVIMDVCMPELDGLECTRRLKADESTSHIPVIMASAASKGEDIVAGLEAGADEYITKPFDAKEFRLRVGSMVRLRRAHRELAATSEVLGEQNRNLNVLLELSCDLNLEDDPDAVLRHIMTAAVELTGCADVSVLLPDRERSHLRVAAAFGREHGTSSGGLIPVARGLCGRAFLTSKPIFCPSMEEILRLRHALEERILSGPPAAAIPLRTKAETVGVLILANRLEGRCFDGKELAYLDMIANLGAATLHDLHMRRSRDNAHESIVVALAKLAEHRDDDTGKHLDRVTLFCVTLAEELRTLKKYSAEIDDGFIRDLRLAVPLHDIGKVAVPDNILLKPGRLTPQEMDIMRQHVRIGAETIRSVRERSPESDFLRLAEEICQCHHEWFNGNGYPQGLVGTAIPLSARIAALADVYDALTTKRVYKPAMPHAQAFNIIVNASGTQFDPDVVQAFIDREQDFIELARTLADAESSMAEGAAAEEIESDLRGR